jgi:xanthine dehydrogenase YagT iron-sulfur-binding subunit
MSLSIALTINGTQRTVELEDPRVTLLDLLRERLDLTGTKKGCDRGQCGACTVLLNGRRINSCLALAVSQDGAEVGPSKGWRRAKPATRRRRRSSPDAQLASASQIMSAVGLIQEGQVGDDPERVREGMSGNLCRCGAYRGITEAVLEAQRSLSQAGRKEAA